MTVVQAMQAVAAPCQGGTSTLESSEWHAKEACSAKPARLPSPGISSLNLSPATSNIVSSH